MVKHMSNPESKISIWLLPEEVCSRFAKELRISVSSPQKGIGVAYLSREEPNGYFAFLIRHVLDHTSLTSTFRKRLDPNWKSYDTLNSCVFPFAHRKFHWTPKKPFVFVSYLWGKNMWITKLLSRTRLCLFALKANGYDPFCWQHVLR